MASKVRGSQPSATPSMTMFGDWMVEKASPTCVPRLCTLQISRLSIQRALEAELHTVYIAVKMFGSRHSLRTSEIVLAGSSGNSHSHTHSHSQPQVQTQAITQSQTQMQLQSDAAMELEVCFSLQYSHSLKRDNQLQVLLQRKKRLRYKNSRLPGYKTIACATINMTSVLQRAIEARELDLFAVPVALALAKNGQLEPLGLPPIAQLIFSCSSQPLHDRFAVGVGIGVGGSRSRKANVDAKRPARRSGDEASDAESADPDGAQLSGDADADGASDRDRLEELDHEHEHEHEEHEHESADEMHMDALAQAKTLKYIMELPATANAHEHRRRQNLKQRLRSQLQKMMRGMMRPVDDDDDGRSTRDRGRGKKQKKRSGAKESEGIVDDDLLEAALAAAQTQDQEEQNRLFDELSELNLSAAESEMSDDAESLRSTARPTLRPFFSSKAISEDTLNHDVGGQPLGHNRQPHAYAAGAGAGPGLSAMSGISQSQKRGNSTLPIYTSTNNASGSEPRECYTPPITQPALPAFEPAKRTLAEQLNRLFGDETKQPHTCVSVQVQHAPAGASQPTHACGGLPDPLAFISGASVGVASAQLLADRLTATGVRAVVTPTHAETRSAFSFLATRIAKYCDVHSHAPPLIRVALVGGDAHVNGALRSFVEHFAAKPPSWLRYVLFFIAPLHGTHGHAQTNISRYLSTVDRVYAAHFAEPIWRADEFSTSANAEQLAMAESAARRIRDYLNNAATVFNLPIGEVQITAASTGKHPRTEEDSVFVPFLSEVRVGTDSSLITGDSNDEQSVVLSASGAGSQLAQAQQPSAAAGPNVTASQPIGIQSEKSTTAGLSQSPPGVNTLPVVSGTVTPPNSPAAMAAATKTSSATASQNQNQAVGDSSSASTECIELQLDTWLLPGRPRPDEKESEKELRDDRVSGKDEDGKKEGTKKEKEKEKEKEERERKEKEKRKADSAKQSCLKSMFRAVCVSRQPSLLQLYAACTSLSLSNVGQANSSSTNQLVHAVAPTLLSLVGLLCAPQHQQLAVGSNGSSGMSNVQSASVAQQQLVDLISTLTLAYTVREKKQKMTMRIGKKANKDKEDSAGARPLLFDGVTRLVCSAPARGDKSTPLTISVDGIEHAAVRFFQLSSHWQSHVKHFPVASFLIPPPFATSSAQLPLTVSL